MVTFFFIMFSYIGFYKTESNTLFCLLQLLCAAWSARLLQYSQAVDALTLFLAWLPQFRSSFRCYLYGTSNSGTHSAILHCKQASDGTTSRG